MIPPCKNALTAGLVALICATAGLGQAPPEIKVKLDVKIKKLASFSTDPEIVNAVKASQRHTRQRRGPGHDQ